MLSRTYDPAIHTHVHANRTIGHDETWDTVNDYLCPIEKVEGGKCYFVVDSFALGEEEFDEAKITIVEHPVPDAPGVFTRIAVDLDLCFFATDAQKQAEAGADE